MKDKEIQKLLRLKKEKEVIDKAIERYCEENKNDKKTSIEWNSKVVQWWY